MPPGGQSQEPSVAIAGVQTSDSVLGRVSHPGILGRPSWERDQEIGPLGMTSCDSRVCADILVKGVSAKSGLSDSPLQGLLSRCQFLVPWE